MPETTSPLMPPPETCACQSETRPIPDPLAHAGLAPTVADGQQFVSAPCRNQASAYKSVPCVLGRPNDVTTTESVTREWQLDRQALPAQWLVAVRRHVA